MAPYLGKAFYLRPLLVIKTTDLDKSQGGLDTAACQAHLARAVIYDTTKKPTPTQQPAFEKVKLKRIRQADQSVCPSQICLVIKFGVLL